MGIRNDLHLFTRIPISTILGGGDHHLLLIVAAPLPDVHQVKGKMSEPNCKRSGVGQQAEISMGEALRGR